MLVVLGCGEGREIIRCSKGYNSECWNYKNERSNSLLLIEAGGFHSQKAIALAATEYAKLICSKGSAKNVRRSFATHRLKYSLQR